MAFFGSVTAGDLRAKIRSADSSDGVAAVKHALRQSHLQVIDEAMRRHLDKVSSRRVGDSALYLSGWPVHCGIQIINCRAREHVNVQAMFHMPNQNLSVCHQDVLTQLRKSVARPRTFSPAWSVAKIIDITWGTRVLCEYMGGSATKLKLRPTSFTLPGFAAINRRHTLQCTMGHVMSCVKSQAAGDMRGEVP